jgi:hypothetical protein
MREARASGNPIRPGSPSALVDELPEQVANLWPEVRETPRSVFLGINTMRILHLTAQNQAFP